MATKAKTKHRPMLFVVKDAVVTRIFQNQRVFGKSQFSGIMVPGCQHKSHWKHSAAEILADFASENSSEFCTVGVIIPNVGAAFVPGHAVLSFQDKVIKLRDFCSEHNAPLHH